MVAAKFGPDLRLVSLKKAGGNWWHYPKQKTWSWMASLQNSWNYSMFPVDSNPSWSWWPSHVAGGKPARVVSLFRPVTLAGSRLLVTSLFKSWSLAVFVFSFHLRLFSTKYQYFKPEFLQVSVLKIDTPNMQWANASQSLNLRSGSIFISLYKRNSGTRGITI